MDSKKKSDRVLGKSVSKISDKFNSVCGEVRYKVVKCAFYSSMAMAFSVSAGIAEDPFLMIPAFMFTIPICKSYEGVTEGLEELRSMYDDELSKQNKTPPAQDKSDPPDFKPR
ncbi:hypothetical protein [Halomonas sp. MMSF_3323]|uniref:hypothetical protein n=1 Tax=Halomonas sp. MMSF_3323 TaxID=3046701 RepID=UPI00273F1E08|nr:hypothetical protein [Halomonas sp. MMSF_3323]